MYRKITLKGGDDNMKIITKEEAEKLTPREAAEGEFEETADFETTLILTEKICLYLASKDVLGLSIGEDGEPKWYLHKRYKGKSKKQLIEEIEKRTE